MIEFLLKNKELIAIFSGIGTFVSALIAAFTLIEVKKQRLSLYRPDILIKSFLVSISKSPLQKESEELIEYKSCDFNDYSNDYNKINFEISSKYKVDNLGFGVAKNLKCIWKFDTRRAIKELEKILPNDYQINWHKKLDLYFLHDRQNDDFHYSASAKIGCQEIDYISPIGIQKHNHFHAIPEIILFTHYLFLVFNKNLTDKKGENFNVFNFKKHKFPNPILKVKFVDVNGKKYSNKYKFELTAVTTQNDETLDLTKEFAYIEFELK